MSINGVRTLQKIEILYCHKSGSSDGVKRLIYEGNWLLEWAKKNPAVQVQFTLDRYRHPVLICTYKRISKTTGKPHEIYINLRNETAGQVQYRFEQVLRREGQRSKNLKQWKLPVTHNLSFQGTWYPGLWGRVSANAVMEVHRHVPEPNWYLINPMDAKRSPLLKRKIRELKKYANW